MINMKRTAKEIKQGDNVTMDEPDYPYGLSISLDDESLAKLGITAMPEPGATMTLQAKVEVTSTSQHKDQDDKSQSLSLQITDMELSGSVDPDAKALYTNSDMS